jgi:parallel beta-helix repeat protein
MATLNVSNAAELRSAINSASGGDTIQLANGSYGDVSIRNVDDLTLKAEGSGAVLDGLNIRGADNLTVDGLSLEGGTDGSGYGTGTGLTIKSSSDVTIQNTDISDYSKGIQVWDVSGLKISANTLDNISYDGIVLGHVSDTLIDGNDVTMHGRENIDHKDAIQVYNQGSKAATSNLVISNNTLTAEDANIHGIYMGNADAKNTGSSGEYYSNITITGNVVDTQNMLGIAVGETNGLTVTDNVVLQNSGAESTRAMNTPQILVAAEANNVHVSGNTVIETPGAATSNWQDASISGSGWSISGNAVVSVSTSVAQYLSGMNTGSGTGASTGTSTSTSTSTATSAAENHDATGSADTFRFTGDGIDGDTQATVSGFDFGAGDALKLGRYDAGTFEDVRGGNVVHNNTAGDYVKIDSLTDIAEIAASSKAVDAHVSGDDLVISIDQQAGTLDIVLAGLGQDYQNSYDTTLF